MKKLIDIDNRLWMEFRGRAFVEEVTVTELLTRIITRYLKPYDGTPGEKGKGTHVVYGGDVEQSTGNKGSKGGFRGRTLD